MGKMKELGLLDCEDRQSIEENFERMKKSSGGDLLETVETEVPLVITWDGNTEGKETVEIEEGAYFVKVYDDVLSVDQLLGGTVIANMEEGKQTIELTTETVMDASSQGMPAIFIMQELALVVYGDVSSTLGMNLSNGVWFAVSGEYYIESISIPNVSIEKVKTQLKPSLLPPHSHKWDDIEDAICGEVEQVLFSEENAKFYYNPNAEIANGEAMVALEMEPLPIVVGDEYTVKWDGTDYKCVASSPMSGIAFLGNESYTMGTGDTGEPFAYMFADLRDMGVPDLRDMGVPDLRDMGVPDLQSQVIDIEAVKSGATENTYHDISIIGKGIKKIDSKFYDQPCYEEFTCFFSGTLINSVYDNTYNQYQYPVFQDVPLTEGETVKITINGITEEKIVKKRNTDREQYYIGNEAFYANDGETEDTGENYCFMYDPDMKPYTNIFVSSNDGDYEIKLEENKITPLPPKFMPELTQVILKSTTEGSTKKFRVTVDDTGALTAVEV